MRATIPFIALLALFSIPALAQTDHPATSTASLDRHAYALYQQKRYQEAFALYQRAANRGDLNAEDWVGAMYRDGQGVDKNPDQAIVWLTKAANRGFSHSAQNLAYMYFLGDGVQRDGAKAIFWFQRLASLEGDGWPYYEIGQIYRNGLYGVTPDVPAGVSYYKKAAQRGNINAMLRLALMYSQDEGIPQDLDQARFWYRTAIDAGSVVAQQRLADLNARTKQPQQANEATANAHQQGTCAAVYIVVGDDNTYGQHFYYGAAWGRSTYADALAGAKSELLRVAGSNEIDPRQLPDAGGRYATAPELGSGCAYAHGAVAGKLKIAPGGCSMYNSGCAAGAGPMGAGIYDAIAAGFANSTDAAASQAIQKCRTTNGSGDNDHETCAILRQW